MTTVTYALPQVVPNTDEAEYQPFPDVSRRNLLQETLEVPIMTWALHLPRGGRVLEVGCGRGIALRPLARALRPTQLVGIDVDGGLIAEARRRAEEAGVAAELRVADVRALPFPDASFDLVVDFGTCYHIARAARALAEIARVLTPGGLFVEETPLSQFLSHPIRSLGRRVPWSAAPSMASVASRLLWERRARR
jgi:ubiquinone/menaquinone biosynthesis C-methylase UbiE